MNYKIDLILSVIIFGSMFNLVSMNDACAEKKLQNVSIQYVFGHGCLLLTTFSFFKKRKIMKKIKGSLFNFSFSPASIVLFMECGFFCGLAKTFSEGLFINATRKEKEDLTNINKKIFFPLYWLIEECKI